MTLMAGTPDIGGSRASMCLMAAEELGIDYDAVRPIIADTSSCYTFPTGGSRATFSNGVALKEAATVIGQACARAAKIWEVAEDAVKWEDGHARPTPPATPAISRPCRSPTSPRSRARPAA